MTNKPTPTTALARVGMQKIAPFIFAALLSLGSAKASESEQLAPANISVSNIASLQRGARIFFNYCAGCHSLKFMRYSRIGEDLHLSEDEVMRNFNFSGAKYGDTVQVALNPSDAEKWFGKAPPDLSLEARSKGVDWIYNYLKSFYLDPNRPLGWNNALFPNASMPNVLWELQGTQQAEFVTIKEGNAAHEKLEKFVLASPGQLTPEQFDQMTRDITAFLQYVGEPAILKRESLGVWVILFLAGFTFIAWLLKREYWKDVH